jgi:hypothetical protein
LFDDEYNDDMAALLGKNEFGALPIDEGNCPLPVENGVTIQGSMVDDELDEDDVLVVARDVTGKLDIGKSGLIFNVLASAFSWRRHLARRF